MQNEEDKFVNDKYKKILLMIICCNMFNMFA